MSPRDDSVRNDASRLVSGRFRCGDLLGIGGSASVYAAVDVRTGASLALKILHPHLSERPAAREAFLAEARRAEPLRHRNIVGVLGVGVDDAAGGPLAWIALERAAGSSLSAHVARHGPLSPAEAVAVVDGILRALEAAHAIDLVHRDVSPSNVMVAAGDSGALETDGVRLLDFGLADAAGTAALGTDDLLSVDARGREGVIGNVNYMSPEQMSGMPVDRRGDVYQVGAVLYFALTGRPPFPRETTGQTMRAHLSTPPPAPSATDSRIPRALDRIVVRAMLKDPDDRFASAAAMRADLAALDVGGGRPVVPAARSKGVTDAAGSDVLVDPAVTTAVLPVASDLRADPAELDSVTRVLGSTRVPPRASGATGAAPIATRPIRGPRRARSRAGTWFAVAGAVVVFGAIVVFAATSAPIPPVETVPSPTPVEVETDAPPEPEPSFAEPVVALMTVPDLSRLSVAEAARALTDSGLVVGELVFVDSAHPRDTVLESSPAAGRRLGAGTAVALTIASGSNTVPTVAGQTRDEAAAAVSAAGFVTSFATRPAPAGTTPGTVLGTTPNPGATLAVGDTVTILEAAPESTQEPTPQPTSTPTPSPSSPPAPDDE